MENFVLYEELGRGNHSIIYKGRRKGTINFVAIHCIDKCKRPEVTNTVRMTHDIVHQNVVKFYEWYETSNHLWLVVELCTGGSLENLISQDKSLPESSVRTFGIDLVTGLHYIHSLGILFCDLRPSKVLLDGPGILKFSDFGLSKVEGENLDDLFQKFSDAGETWTTDSNLDDSKRSRVSGSPNYTAPEVLQGGEITILSDLWSLGCVFYELFTGHPPFLAESFPQLQDKIVNKAYPPPKVKGSRFTSKPSHEFLSLIDGLLTKDLDKRMGWPGLVTHPFWEGNLTHLAKDLVMSQDVHGSMATTARSSVFVDGTGSVLGKVKTVEIMTERTMSNLQDIESTSRPGTAAGDFLRPKTAPSNDGGASLFTLSARPHTAVPPDERVNSPQRQPQSPLATREPLTSTRDQSESSDTKNEILDLIYHHSDFTVSSIVDNPKIQKPTSAKYDAKTLPVPPFTAEKFNSLPEKDQTKHMKAILDNINSSEKGPPSQKRIQLLHYMATFCSNSAVATFLVKNEVLTMLAKQLKEVAHTEVRGKIARVIGIMACNLETLDESTRISEVLTIITEVFRENVKNNRLKQGLLPAIGELVYLIAVQEDGRKSSIEAWSIPSMTFAIICRSCRDGEDPLITHIAAKIVENVATTKGQVAQKFVTTEMAQSLWYSFRHSTVDALRITSLSALHRITSHNPQVFQSVIDTVGLSTLLSALSFGITRIQQSIVTMFGALIVSGASLNRLMQDKDFLQKILRLLESPSTVIRAKGFIVLHELVKNNHDVLLNSCQLRLVMYIERDGRRQTPRDTKTDSAESFEYLNRCLDLLINYISDCVPNIMNEILSSLEAVSGRKHPNTVQAKQLKNSLPLIHIFMHLVTSQVFRPKVVNVEFVKGLSSLLTHVKRIEAGDTNIESASGVIAVGEFVNTVMSVVEGISQHPALLMEHGQVVMETILPTLAELVISQNGDTRALALSLFSEIATVFLTQDTVAATGKIDTKQLNTIIGEKLFPHYEQILLDQDPLPSYGLKLLLALLESNTGFIKQFEKLGLVSVIFQVLLDHQNNPLSSAMQSIAGILNCLVSHKETNMKELYEQGLIDYFTTLFFEVSAACFEGEDSGGDNKTVLSMLQTLLETLHGLFKYVSDFVRKALQVGHQAKKAGGDAQTRETEEAEQLLLMNKALTDLTSLLTQLLCHEDTDIHDPACKCLSLLVQLFGGEHKEALNPENMDYYSKALKKADAKKQKVLLRIIKRLVSTDKHHAESMRSQGENLANTIKSLVKTASSHADVSLSSLAAEILKITGHLR